MPFNGGASLYNTRPQTGRRGLRRDYNNHLHPGLADKVAVARSNEQAVSANDDSNIHGPLEGSSSGEEIEKAKDDGDSGDSLSDAPPSRISRCRAVKPRKGWKEPPPAEHEDEPFEESSRPKKKSKTYGKSANIRNIHTSQQDRAPAQKQKQTEKSDTKSVPSKAFKQPGGQDALQALDSLSSSSSTSTGFKSHLADEAVKSTTPLFKPPLAAPPAPPPATQESFKMPRPRIATPKRGSRTRAGTRSNKTSQTRTDDNSAPSVNITDELATFSSAVDPALTSKLRTFSVPAAPPATTSSSLSSPPSSPLSPTHSAHSPFEPDSSATTAPLDTSTASSPKCPRCQALIPATLLPSFLATYSLPPTTRLSLPQQRTFCRHHTEASAHSSWSAAGYPTISWPTLPSRLEPLKPHILALIEDRVPSYYRYRLRQLNPLRRAEGGGRATLMTELEERGDEAELLGYYGTKGRAVVSGFVMREFGKALGRRLGVDGDLVLTAGVAGFVQLVLVPEVVMRLVVEDRRAGQGEGERDGGLEEEEARRVMDESAELGRVLCEEEEDVIESGSEEEGGYGE